MILSYFLRRAGLVLMLAPAVAVLNGQGIAMKAYEMRMNGDAVGAMALLDSALKVNPESAELWFEKARCHDWTKAVGCTKFTHTWTKMGPRMRQTRRCLDKACSLDPANARYHNLAAENRAMLTLLAIYSPWQWPAMPVMYHKMARDANASVHFAPDNPQYRYNMIIYGRMGGLGGSREKFLPWADTLYNLDPVYGVMAYKEMETKKHPYDAGAMYYELGHKYPDHKELLKKTALSGSRGGQNTENAIQACKRLLELDPRDTWALKQWYRVLPAGRKSEIIPVVDSYLKSVENDYAFYKAAGYRILVMYYSSAGSAEKAKEYQDLANRYCPEGYGTATSDMMPPVE